MVQAMLRSTGVTPLVGLLDDGPEIAIKSDFFTAGESTYIFEQLKGANQLAAGSHALRSP